MNRGWRSLAVASALILSSVSTAGLSAQEGSFQGTTSVIVVEVPVNVVRNGQAVRGLSAENFEIVDGDERREIIGFDVVDLVAVEGDLVEPLSADVPMVARRHFLLLFDLSFSGTRALDRSVEAARDLLASGLHRTDLVAVGIHSGTGGAELLLNFTPDRQQARKAVEALEGALGPDGKAQGHIGGRDDPLNLVARDSAALRARVGRSAGRLRNDVAAYLEDGGIGGGGIGGDGISETLLEMAQMEQMALMERRRGEVESMAVSLADLARRTAGMEGRKHLVLFSEGFDPYSFQDGVSNTLRVLRKAMAEFRLAGWVIQGVDTQLPGAGDVMFDGGEGLSMLARETGGELYQRFNQLSVAMEQMLEKTGVTYILAFQTEEMPADGAFHRVRVRLRDVPGGEVFHRTGYLAAAPPERESTQIELAQLLLGGEVRREIGLAAQAVPFKSAALNSPVSVILELNGPDLLDGHNGSTLTTDIYGYVFASGGEIVDFFGSSLILELRGKRELLGRHGLRVFGELELPPGSYSMRLVVRNPGTGRYTVDTVPILVPELEGPDARLLASLFVEPRPGPAVVMRRDASADRPPGDYRFRIGEKAFVPAVAPQFDGQDSHRICAFVYQLDPSRYRLRTDLKRVDGTRVEAGHLKIVGRGEPDEVDVGQIFLMLDPNGLPDAEYIVEVSLVNTQSGATSTVSSPFRVVEPD